MQVVDLANVLGLRSQKGGKNQPRHKVVKGGVGQKFRGERARYAVTEQGFRNHLQELYRDFTNGEVSMSEFYKTFKDDLYKFQVEMYVLGRRAVGREDGKLDKAELAMLHGLHSREFKYFNGFIRDYLNSAGKMPYNQRLDLYALGGYRVYLRGALAALPFADQMRFKWVVNREAEHCDDCLAKEKLSEERGGFTLKELEDEIGLPGDKCECGRRCRCHVELPGGIKQLPRTQPTAFRKINKHYAKPTKPSETQSGAPSRRRGTAN